MLAAQHIGGREIGRGAAAHSARAVDHGRTTGEQLPQRRRRGEITRKDIDAGARQRLRLAGGAHQCAHPKPGGAEAETQVTTDKAGRAGDGNERRRGFAQADAAVARAGAAANSLMNIRRARARDNLPDEVRGR